MRARAEAVARRYQSVIWREDGEWYGRGLELPTTMADGPTPAECVKNLHEAFVATVAWMLEEGKSPPPPASENVRSEQVNLRVTAEEKLSLEAAARRRGCDGISDFVRTAALEVAAK